MQDEISPLMLMNERNLTEKQNEMNDCLPSLYDVCL